MKIPSSLKKNSLYYGVLAVAVLALVSVLVMPHVVSAIQFDPNDQLNPDATGLPGNSPSDTIFIIIRGFLQLVGLIALVLIMYAGFLWLTAAGNKDRIEKGQTVLLWSIIGLLLILSSLGIVQFLDSFL